MRTIFLMSLNVTKYFQSIFHIKYVKHVQFKYNVYALRPNLKRGDGGRFNTAEVIIPSD